MFFSAARTTASRLATRVACVSSASIATTAPPSSTMMTAVRTMTSTGSSQGKKVAIVLAGCGVYDGSETTEVVSAMIHLSRAGTKVSAFAPDKEQMHVVNHLTGDAEEGQTRNVLTESARIARGNIKALDECDADDFDALVIPGGFGAAKNLSTFATQGADMTVDPILEEIMVKFHKEGKPIGLCCIAPTIAAKVFGKTTGCTLTVGHEEESEMYPFAGAAGAIKGMGAHHQICEPSEGCIDEENKIVTSSGYMYAGQPHEVDDSVRAMVEGVLSLA
mmetsp:Transcript_26314/g.63159  ORF Transcript_26314/g.63159 Transcript_26314/m.63159 type:complete len:277 (+) Transcript_26314:47-877(+)